MVRTDLLAGQIAMRGKKKKEVAKALDITVTALRKKMMSGRFTCDEALILIEFLGIDDPVGMFFYPLSCET